jgi:short-subunit dehydrogenase
MSSYTLITGASSGIGRALAIQLAAENHALILTARRFEQLQRLKQEIQAIYPVQVEIITADLTQAEEAEQLYHAVAGSGMQVNVLVNNAGVGLYGAFEDIELQQQQHMIQLNVLSLVTLTKLFGQDMLKRKSGTILNMASLLSYIPFPYYSTYSATKAFVLAFSETMHAEWKPKGVHVCSLCPGPTDTAFTTAAMTATRGYAANPPMLAEDVARAAVQLLQRKQRNRVVGWNNWFISNLPRITPDALMLRIKTYLATPKR